MKGTALENGLKHDWYIDERSDPQKATIAAANYLKTLAEQFGGDWQLALASYNSGPGRVQRAIKHVGQSDFWSISAKTTALPRETSEYVPMILAAIIISRNPAQYGFRSSLKTQVRRSRRSCRVASIFVAWPSGQARRSKRCARSTPSSGVR